MNGHNVTELHSFFRYARCNVHNTLHATFLAGHATVPTRTPRPATAILRPSWPYPARPPYYIHATDQLPQRSTRNKRLRYTCFPVDKPYCIRYNNTRYSHTLSPGKYAANYKALNSQRNKNYESNKQGRNCSRR